MINPIKQLDFLEKQSKSSASIMMILSYTGLAIGFLFTYASTMDIIIKDKVLFGLGGAIVLVSLFCLLMLFKATYKLETLSRHQELVTDTIQMLKDELDLYMKLIEYNEKAIKYNEKHREPKMQILTYGDLTNSVELHFDTRSSLFKKS